MSDGYRMVELTCEACGHSHSVHSVGENHLASCLACGTDEPGFDREVFYR